MAENEDILGPAQRAQPAQLIKGSFVFWRFDLLNGENSKVSRDHDFGQQGGDFGSILGAFYGLISPSFSIFTLDLDVF